VKIGFIREPARGQEVAEFFGDSIDALAAAVHNFVWIAGSEKLDFSHNNRKVKNAAESQHNHTGLQ
jgi:hypothetical protein